MEAVFDSSDEVSEDAVSTEVEKGAHNSTYTAQDNEIFVKRAI